MNNLQIKDDQNVIFINIGFIQLESERQTDMIGLSEDANFYLFQFILIWNSSVQSIK